MLCKPISDKTSPPPWKIFLSIAICGTRKGGQRKIYDETKLCLKQKDTLTALTLEEQTLNLSNLVDTYIPQLI